MFLGGSLLACSGSGSSTEAQAVTQCLQRKPSVNTGVYGCVTSSDDVGPPEPPEAFSGFTLDVFDSEPPPTPDDGLPPAATSTSDAIGFFEIELAPGAHWLCTAFRRCVRVDVTDATTQAFNYDFGPGPGW
jgi:hypothetical protein